MFSKSIRHSTCHTAKVVSLLVLTLSCVTSATAQTTEVDSLSMFLKACPEAVEMNVLNEGTKLYMAADDESLLVNLSLANPMLQMRLLMQPTHIYIDPTGKKRKNFQIALPSALDVKEELEATHPQDMSERNSDTRPDIRPLIEALNRKGAVYVVNGKARQLNYQHFYLELNQEEERINLYLLLPLEELMDAKKVSKIWSVGIWSDIDQTHMPPPEQNEPGEGMMQPLDDRRMDTGNDSAREMQELMMSNIRQWTKFAIDDVNNANLTE